MLSVETWKPVPGYEDLYKCSNFGRIKSLQRKYEVQIRDNCKILVTRKEKILKLFINEKGYVYCTLCKKNKYKSFQVHVIIAKVFLNDSKNIKGLQVNHKDGDSKNNNLNNLEIITRSENQLHRYKRVNYILKMNDCFRKKPFFYSFTYNGVKIKSRYFSTFEECKFYLLIKLKELNYYPKYLDLEFKM